MFVFFHFYVANSAIALTHIKGGCRELGGCNSETNLDLLKVHYVFLLSPVRSVEIDGLKRKAGDESGCKNVNVCDWVHNGKGDIYIYIYVAPSTDSTMFFQEIQEPFSSMVCF